MDVLVDFRRVDVDVQDFRFGCKGFHITDHPVRKPRAQRNQQIAVVHAQIGGFGAVHANHAGIAGIRSVKSAFSHQGIADRSVHQTGEGAHLFGRSGKHCAAAHIQVGLLRFGKKLQRFLQLLLREPV